MYSIHIHNYAEYLYITSQNIKFFTTCKSIVWKMYIIKYVSLFLYKYTMVSNARKIQHEVTIYLNIFI